MSEDGEQGLERYPSRITLFCDGCRTELAQEYVVDDSMTKAERFARRCVREQALREQAGWTIVEDPWLDLCPSCARKVREELGKGQLVVSRAEARMLDLALDLAQQKTFAEEGFTPEDEEALTSLRSRSKDARAQASGS